MKYAIDRDIFLQQSFINIVNIYYSGSLAITKTRQIGNLIIACFLKGLKILRRLFKNDNINKKFNNNKRKKHNLNPSLSSNYLLKLLKRQ